jgi:hypothetical protein
MMVTGTSINGQIGPYIIEAQASHNIILNAALRMLASGNITLHGFARGLLKGSTKGQEETAAVFQAFNQFFRLSPDTDTRLDREELNNASRTLRLHQSYTDGTVDNLDNFIRFNLTKENGRDPNGDEKARAAVSILHTALQKREPVKPDVHKARRKKSPQPLQTKSLTP